MLKSILKLFGNRDNLFSLKIDLSSVIPVMIVAIAFHSRINNCVGESNQKYFIQFLLYVGKLIFLFLSKTLLDVISAIIFVHFLVLVLAPIIQFCFYQQLKTLHILPFWILIGSINGLFCVNSKLLLIFAFLKV